MSDSERIKRLEDALRPFAAVADEYDKDGLDECRPDWVRRGISKLDVENELYAGRGGKTLITLGHILEARNALVRTSPFLRLTHSFLRS